MTSSPAPVVLFAFNRDHHVKRCLVALSSARSAKSSRIYVFVDGARHATEKPLTERVITLASEFAPKFLSMQIVARDRNLGLAKNIIEGVSQVVSEYGRAIVLEDDLIVSPGFIDFMNWGLNRFHADQRIGSLHGYCYPGMPTNPPLFLMKGGDCWGWATWRDRWTLFEPSGRKLLLELLRRRKLYEFTLAFSAPYCRMLCRQISGHNSSWAVRWHASLFLQDRYTVYPSKSLVHNIGLDSSGTHCGTSELYGAEVGDIDGIDLDALPELKTSQQAYRHFQSVFDKDRSGISRMVYRTSSFVLDTYWIIRALLSQ